MVSKDKTRETTYEDESVTSPEARRREFGQEDHVRWYGLDFPQRLEAAGFNVSIKMYVSEVGGDTADRYGLKVHDRVADDGRFEDIHHCTK